jgi:ABC-type Fe3+-hydroxamate transport system substrate-binding protein
MRVCWFLFFFLSFTISNVLASSCVVTDDAGQSLQLSSPAKRIIVLAPDLVENVFAIGAGDQVIGVVQGCDYPSAARRIAQVGSYMGIDLERIVALKPDLIIAWKYAFPRQLAALKRLGIPVYVAAPKKLEDVPRLMRHLGCLTAHEQSAEVAAHQFEDSMKHLPVRAANKPRVKVFFQIDRYALMTVNQDSWINQVIELCGGRNLFADAKVIAPEVSRESILMANPDVIFNVAENNGWQSAWQRWSQIAAVRDHRLYSIEPDWIARAGPRLVLGARQACAAMVSA